MHLQQTKAGSLRSGGPQYYFHNLDAPIRDYLERRGACPVVLMTPYGIAPTSFMAVGRNHKLGEDGKPRPGKVGHDRIQQADASQSIGEAIRTWYALPPDKDFERIDVEAMIHPAGHFILIPTAVVFRQHRRRMEIERPERPLSLNRKAFSPLWQEHLKQVRQSDRDDWIWAGEEIARVVSDHRHRSDLAIHEADLLRASGALSVLGLRLGPYLVRGYDCDSCFQFLRYPVYRCPVEIKKASRRFRYQIERYHPLPRAVILCIEHDLVHVPPDIDVIELSFLADFIARADKSQ